MDDYEKYDKTALKDNDFTKFFRGKVILDESEDMMAKLDKKESFNNVIKSDAAFFAKTNIIDYSLLLGEILTPLDELEDLIEEDRNLTHGVYISTESEHGRKAYVIGIIDPLTGFTFKKGMEFRFKQLRYGMEMSCVPPDEYSKRFSDFMTTEIKSSTANSN